jgi:phosphatidylserine decarboxylase
MSPVTYATAQLLRILPRARIGRAIGRLAERPWSPSVGRAVVGAYSRIYAVQLDECAQGTWGSFDAFFTRRLREGARLVDPDPHAVVSPADGRIESMSAIEPSGTLLVKGRPYSVAELVGDAEEARRFVGGAGCVVYLSPRDYHRVHAPVSGAVGRIRSMPGDYYPVNAIGVRHVSNLFCRNRRVAIEIDADAGLGRVTVVMVVAMIVGKITTLGVRALDVRRPDRREGADADTDVRRPDRREGADANTDVRRPDRREGADANTDADTDVPLGDHLFSPPLGVRRGDEIGVFHLGSTAVVLVEGRGAGRWVVREGAVRYGQALMRREREVA